MRTWAISLVALAGCGGGGARVPATPGAVDTRPIATVPAAAQAALYAGCLSAAVAAKSYAHARDPDTSLLLFTCDGDAARAFYDGLAAWSAKIGSQLVAGSRTIRATQHVRRDLFGVDYCETDGATYKCVITLNVGDFLDVK